jgi:hypothetical protein
LQASKANQRDMVISFRKPVRRPGGRKIRPSAIQEDIDATVRKLIGDYLETHPGAKKDRVYDFLIGRLVQLGRMEPHDFEALFKEAQANASGTLRVP